MRLLPGHGTPMSRRVAQLALAIALTLPLVACQADHSRASDPLIFVPPDHQTRIPEPGTQPTRPAEPIKPIERPETLGVKRMGELLEAAVKKVDSAHDFRALLVRREMVSDELQPEEVLDFRQRFKPHSLRLEWKGDRFKGRKMLYVDGQNDSKVLVRLGAGLMGLKLWQFDLDSATLKPYSRYTPDQAGYDRLVRRITRDFERARREKRAAVAVFKPEMKGGHRIQKFEMTVNPVVSGLHMSRLIVWFDLDAELPVHVIVHDASGRLVEDYDWRDLQLDAGLSSDDFAKI